MTKLLRFSRQKSATGVLKMEASDRNASEIASILFDFWNNFNANVFLEELRVVIQDYFTKPGCVESDDESYKDSDDASDSPLAKDKVPNFEALHVQESVESLSTTDDSAYESVEDDADEEAEAAQGPDDPLEVERSRVQQFKCTCKLLDRGPSYKQFSQELMLSSRLDYVHHKSGWSPKC